VTKARWPELLIDVGRLLRRDSLAELKRRPAERSEDFTVDETVIAVGLTTSTAEVPDEAEVHVNAELRPTMRGVQASIRATSRWEAECRRCLKIVGEPIEIDTTVSFLSELDLDRAMDGDDADAYPIAGERVDLGEVIREELMLSLPLSPLCSDGCEGADPERFPTANGGLIEPEGDEDDGIDPRWAGLSALTFDEE